MPNRRAPERIRRLVFATLASVPTTAILITLTGLHAHPWAIPASVVPAVLLATWVALTHWR